MIPYWEGSRLYKRVHNGFLWLQHDEAPAEFNRALLAFIEEVTRRKAECGVAVAAAIAA